MCHGYGSCPLEDSLGECTVRNRIPGFSSCPTDELDTRGPGKPGEDGADEDTVPLWRLQELLGPDSSATCAFGRNEPCEACPEAAACDAEWGAEYEMEKAATTAIVTA